MEVIALPGPQFEDHAFVRFTSCGASFYVTRCPLCSWTLEDPLFLDYLHEQFEKHMRAHETR
jgi:hypothetical protein